MRKAWKTFDQGGLSSNFKKKNNERKEVNKACATWKGENETVSLKPQSWN